MPATKCGIIAFAFGVPAAIRSNRQIALIASDQAKKLNAPVFTQADVRLEHGITASRIDEEPGKPPPTLRMARDAIKWAIKNGITELHVVAAKPHMWRAHRDVRRAVQEIGMQHRIAVHSIDTKFPKDSWFCVDSTQERVRSPEAWNKRERILKWLPFFIYKRVAS